MKRQKRVLTVLLVVSMVFTLVLAACSTGKNKDGKSGESAPASQSETPQPSSASSDSNSPAADDLPKETGNKSISFLLSDIGATYARTHPMTKDDKYISYLNKISGYDTSYEFLVGNGDEFTTGITARFASGDLPNVIRTNSVDDPVYHKGAVESGVFWDLTDLLDKYAPELRKGIPEDMWNSPKVTFNGRIYGIPSPSGFYEYSRVMYVRQDWLDKLGMKQPNTLDEWMAYFDAVSKTDMDGNGKLDEFGYDVQKELKYSEIFFGNFNAYPTAWYEQDGKMIPGIIAPGMKDALLTWKKMYDNKYINQDFMTITNEQAVSYIFSGKAGSWQGDVGNYSDYWGPASSQWAAGVKPAISMLTGPDGATLVPKSDGIYFVKVFPKQHENIVDVLKYLEWAWTSPEATKFFNLGIPDHNYTVKDGKLNWSAADKNNADDLQSYVYWALMDPVKLAINNEDILSISPDYNILMDGLEKAKKSAFANEAFMYMPTLKSLENNPELLPGTQTGALFMDMFAKVVTGREDVNNAFPAFVKEWKSRGGDQAIEEATQWYTNYKNSAK